MHKPKIRKSVLLYKHILTTIYLSVSKYYNDKGTVQ